jgi:soluble lytic murein transglycosylase-like protein
MKRTIALIFLVILCGLFWSHSIDVKARLHDATLSYSRSLDDIRSENETKAAQWVYKNSSRMDRETIGIVVKESFKYKHPLLLLAIIHAESEFNSTVVSSADAIGLGQIRWIVWGPSLVKAGIAKEKRDLYNPKVSIAAMNHILEFYLEAKQGVVPLALEGYLGGKSKPYTDKIAYSFLSLSTTKV